MGATSPSCHVHVARDSAVLVNGLYQHSRGISAPHAEGACGMQGGGQRGRCARAWASAERSEPGAWRGGQQEGGWAWGEWRGWLVCTVDMSCAKLPRAEPVSPQCGDYFRDNRWELSRLPS